MVENDLVTLLALAEETARKAGKFLLDHETEAGQIESSQGHDIKLRGDHLAEDIIVEALSHETDFPLLSEERGEIGGPHPGGLRWVVDPLDGSLNFTHKLPFCSISIALFEGREPRMGLVYDFNRDEMFTGIVGKGAWLNSDPIHVSSTPRKQEAVLCTGFPVYTDFSTGALEGFILNIQEYKKVRLLGSAALSLAYVACGRVDAYTEKNIMLWDVGGGLALVAAAGGRSTIGSEDDAFLDLSVLATNATLSGTSNIT